MSTKDAARSSFHMRMSKAAKRRLRKVSRAKDQSMTDYLMDALEAKLQADDDAAQPAPGLGTAWVAENKGLLIGKLKKADYERDDMTGYALRKYART